jgi:TRAP-type mannitol/chloroaromatic compound transport system permease small subunit
MTAHASPARDPWAFAFRLFCWGMVTLSLAFVFETWAMFWQGQPSARSGGAVALAGYGAALLATLAAAVLQSGDPLRRDSDRISAIVAYMARAAFWAVLLVGTADALLSLLRVENLLPVLFGDTIAQRMGLSAWRGPNVHMPLAALGLVIAFFTRGLGFIWLALLVVAIQLLMVIGRFVFSYEQPFLADLVRMFYAGLFLFASAYTLVEEGHVRVDVFFAAMSTRARALVNGMGSVVFGMTMMWLILILGTTTPASTITGPILRFEQGQQTYGMMTKYWMAAYLGIFALMMLMQFASYVLKAVADWRGEPDLRARTQHSTMG